MGSEVSLVQSRGLGVRTEHTAGGERLLSLLVRLKSPPGGGFLHEGLSDWHAGKGARLRVVFLVTDYPPCVLHPSLRRSRPHHNTACRTCRDGNADMTSVHITNPDQVDARGLATRDRSARLSLKPSSSARGAVDGVWWPRSADPAVEHAALIEELGIQRRPVGRLALNRARWGSAPRRIPLASGRKVAVDWFHTGDVRMIQIIDTNYQQIDLLVIPVDTTPAIAELALTMATNGQDPDITPRPPRDRRHAQ
jgi:hypothetical protein